MSVYVAEAIRCFMVEQLSQEVEILPIRLADPTYWAETLGQDPGVIAEIVDTYTAEQLWHGVPWFESVKRQTAAPLDALRAMLVFRAMDRKITQDLKWNAAEGKAVIDFFRVENAAPVAPEIESIDEVFARVPHAILEDQYLKSCEREKERKQKHERKVKPKGEL